MARTKGDEGMNRFKDKFLVSLVKLSKEYGYVITEGGYIEPISDWIEDNKSFKYTTEKDETGVKITGVEMY